MQYIFLTVLFIFSSYFPKCQNNIDSICNKICKSIKRDKKPIDSNKVWEVFEKFSFNYLSKFNAAERDSLESYLYFRLQRNCNTFKDMLDRNSSSGEIWKTVSKKPKSNINKSECDLFAEFKRYKYVEENGDTTYLQIDHDIWLDNFRDGSYSKLKIIWGARCDFVIEFIESNNDMRKRFSKPGDKYRYTLIEKFKDYYLVSVEIIGGQKKRYSLFKLYW